MTESDRLIVLHQNHSGRFVRAVKAQGEIERMALGVVVVSGSEKKLGHEPSDRFSYGKTSSVKMVAWPSGVGSFIGTRVCCYQKLFSLNKLPQVRRTHSTRYIRQYVHAYVRKYLLTFTNL